MHSISQKYNRNMRASRRFRWASVTQFDGKLDANQINVRCRKENNTRQVGVLWLGGSTLEVEARV